MAQQGSSRKRSVKESVHLDFLRKAMEWVVDQSIFRNLQTHGNTSWIAKDLVMLAVLWVWSEKSQLTAAFQEAVVWSKRLFGGVAVGSYQALTNALVRYGGQLVPLLWNRLHQLMEQVADDHWRIGLWLVIAVDGSRVSTPRTKANEKAFRAANYGKSNSAKYRKKKSKNKRKKNRVKAETVTPQIWITLLWHMGLRLPWSWKLGPSDSSERAHFRDMLATQKFPKNTLFCGDAGFVGYDLWRSIIDAEHNFLIRVGGNVRLLTKLGYYARERDGIVYVWPDSAARKMHPPFVLRLIHLKGERGDVYLLTNVLNLRHLSNALASRLYKLRWGIERMFQQVTEVFHLQTLIGSSPRATVFQASFCLLLYNMIQVIRAYIAEPEQREVDTISNEQLFYDVRRELTAWTEVLTTRETVDLLSTTWTLAQVAHRLGQLLHGQWTDRWLKSPSNTHKHVPPQRNEYAEGGHNSVYRIIQEALANP